MSNMLQALRSMLHQIEGQYHVWPHHLHVSTVNHSDYLFLYSQQPHKTHIWFHAVLRVPILHIIAFNATDNTPPSSIRMAWPVSRYVSIRLKTFGKKLYSASLLIVSVYLVSTATQNKERSGGFGLWLSLVSPLKIFKSNTFDLV